MKLSPQEVEGCKFLLTKVGKMTSDSFRCNQNGLWRKEKGSDHGRQCQLFGDRHRQTGNKDLHRLTPGPRKHIRSCLYFFFAAWQWQPRASSSSGNGFKSKWLRSWFQVPCGWHPSSPSQAPGGHVISTLLLFLSKGKFKSRKNAIIDRGSWWWAQTCAPSPLHLHLASPALPLAGYRPFCVPRRSFCKAAASRRGFWKVHHEQALMNRDRARKALLLSPFTLLPTGQLTAPSAKGRRATKCLLLPPILLSKEPGSPSSAIWWCENSRHSPFSGESQPKITLQHPCFSKTPIKITEFIPKEGTNVLKVTPNDAIQQPL